MCLCVAERFRTEKVGLFSLCGKHFIMCTLWTERLQISIHSFAKICQKNTRWIIARQVCVGAEVVKISTLKLSKAFLKGHLEENGISLINHSLRYRDFSNSSTLSRTLRKFVSSSRSLRSDSVRFSFSRLSASFTCANIFAASSE